MLTYHSPDNQRVGVLCSTNVVSLLVAAQTALYRTTRHMTVMILQPFEIVLAVGQLC